MVSGTNDKLRDELTTMVERDLAVRQELVEEGSLAIDGYHPRMERVHKANAQRLAEIIEEHGWPGRELVGEEGARAAWLIAQHAIGEPDFMRRSLKMLQQAASENQVPPWQAAMLEDRIRMYEGRAQVYGTQFIPDSNGEFIPYKIEDPDGVNERRAMVGLNTLEQRWSELREHNRQENVPLPPDWEEQYERWLRSVGWRV